MQSSADSQSATSPPKPIWYISRSPGVFVPLVAADELPHGIHLSGAPRRLQLSQAQDMACLGEVPTSGRTYMLETAQKEAETPPVATPLLRTNEQLPMAPSRGLESSRHATSPTAPVTPNHQTASNDLKLSQNVHSIHKTAGVGVEQMPRRFEESTALRRFSVPSPPARKPPPSNALVGPTRRPLPPSGVEPDQSKKIYCTYWIRTGECDYVQAGCYYRHEMPDLATLNHIGFRSVPKWWVEREAARKLAMRQAGLGPGRVTLTEIKEDALAASKTTAPGVRAAQGLSPQQTMSRSSSFASSRGGRRAPRRDTRPAVPAPPPNKPTPPKPAVPAQQQSREGYPRTVQPEADEPLITLDYPTLVPKNSSPTVSYHETPTHVSAGPASPTLVNTQVGAQAEKTSPAPARQPTPAAPKTPEPIHRFVTACQDQNQIRAALEETNERMSREAREAAAARAEAKAKAAESGEIQAQAQAPIQIQTPAEPGASRGQNPGTVRGRGDRRSTRGRGRRVGRGRGYNATGVTGA